MNWFERHLNWSLFLGLIYIPMNISLTSGLILSIIFVIIGLISYGFSPEALSYLAGLEKASGDMTSVIIAGVVLILILIGVIRFGFWFLDRKGQSRGYVAWLVVPPFAGFGLAFLAAMFFSGMSVVITGLIIAFLGPIVGLIILLFLENRARHYGGDFDTDIDTQFAPETGGLPDTRRYSRPDDWQSKELDYTPAKNVLDIVDNRGIKDAGVTKDATGIGEIGAAGIAGEEAPAPEKVVERTVIQERLKPPILLDDTGEAIRCFYHPGADAVSLCSRCNQYVCSTCSYITGTHPICHNCWGKRAEKPLITIPANKPESQASVKPEKEKIVKPDKPKKEKREAPVKSGKSEADKNEWLPDFMTLYQQALPIINVVIRKSADGTPASPLDLMEGLKLRPMLERVKKLSKPKDKEFREARNELEQVLSSCIKIADAAANFVSGGGQALLGGPDFARIVEGIETANGLMEKLSRRLASFPHPQE